MRCFTMRGDQFLVCKLAAERFLGGYTAGSCAV
jgi:hypothetical protein